MANTGDELFAAAGWTKLLSSGVDDPAAAFDAINTIYVKIATASESNPSGNTYGQPVSGQIAAFRRANMNPVASSVVSNASAQNIATPALPIPEDNALVLLLGTKLDDWTSVAPPAGFTEIGEPSSTLGNDQGLTWGYQIQGAKANISATSFVVTGGASALSVGRAVAFPYVVPDPSVLFEDDLTPTLTSMWLKLPSDATLNTSVTLQGFSDIGRAGKVGVFAVRGRADPIAVTDTRQLRRLQVVLRGDTASKTDQILDLLEPGDVVFLHVPTTSKLRSSLYLAVADVTEVVTGVGTVWRLITLDGTEVAAPGPQVFGSDPADP